MKNTKELAKLGITELSLMIANNSSIRKLVIPVIDNKIRKISADVDEHTLSAEKYAQYCFFRNLLRTLGKRMDEPTEEALKSKEYHQQMIKYDEELAKLLDPVWKKDFSNK